MSRPTRLPEPPDNRVGCGGAVLVLIAGVGTIVSSALCVLVVFFTHEELPDQRSWDVYFAVSLLWAAGAGIAALVTAFAPSTRRGSSPGRRIALLDAAMALAILWPLEVAVFGLYVATRRTLRPGTRLAAPVAGVLVLVGGAWWGGVSYDHAQPREVTQVSRDSLVGEWRTSEGGLLDLGADGRYSATQVPEQLFTGDWESRARLDETGSWTHDAGSGFVFNLDVGIQGGHFNNLAVYRTGSARMLCIVEDFDNPCDSGLTFLPVSGPAAAAR